MKKYLNRIVYLPSLLFFIAVILFTVFYYSYIKNVTTEEFNKAKENIIKTQKKFLKINIESVVSGVNEIRIVTFNSSEYILKNLLNIVIKNYEAAKNKKEFFKKHFNDKLFFYIISKDYVFPSFYQTYIKIRNKHLITVYNGKKYLSVEKKFGDKIIGVAFELSALDKIIKKEIIDYIASLNHGKDYIAFSQITNWDAPNGYFGKMIYHPLKEYMGMRLNINKPDVKGNYFRKEYFECLKEHNGCFVSYYFKNPQSGKIEKKLSYFRIYRPYNYVFVKGVYASDILQHLNFLKKQIFKRFYTIYFNTVLFLLFFTVIAIIVGKYLSDKIGQIMIKEYEKLEKGYKDSRKELIERIYYDKLTGLPSKVKLDEDKEKFKSLILLDIDEFSNLNNLYGFEYGNEILKCVADYLKKRFLNVYRIGSDEFAILLDREIDEEYLKQLADEEVECNGAEIMFVLGASNIKDLFVTAESALKKAVRSKMKYFLYEEELKKIQKEKLEKLKKLRTALQNEDVIPYYQAIVDKNEKITKYEALMRIKIDNQILSPYSFMTLIKDAKLYDEFSKIMIKKVFKDANIKKIPVSINLSFSDIVHEEIRKLILELLEKYKIGDLITFEILESESIQNFKQVKEFIDEVKKYGVKIAIDDFGSGYSNLVNVLSLEPDYIKIDGTLVKNIETPEYYEIVKLINDFAKKFKIMTIAEFVENEMFFKILKEIGIDCFQGYYFYKPAPFDKIS